MKDKKVTILSIYGCAMVEPGFARRLFGNYTSLSAPIPEGLFSGSKVINYDEVFRWCKANNNE